MWTFTQRLGLVLIASILLEIPVSLHARPSLQSGDPESQQWSMGYYTPYDGPSPGPRLPPDAIQWSGLTHVIYTGGNILSDGTVDVSSYQFPTYAPTLISNAHANGVKVLFGLIQCNWCPAHTSDSIQNAITTNLPSLVSNVMNVVNTYGFDGVDLDWDPYNSNTQSTFMFQLLSALRTALGTKLLMATAIWEDQDSWPPGIAYLDRLNVMTYDLSLPNYGFPYSWFNAALYGDHSAYNAQASVDKLVTDFLSRGIPAAKLGIGIPFFGWHCTNVTAPRQTTGWSTATCDQVYYHHMADHGFDISNPTWDSTAQVPWVYQQSLWLNFDNAQSVAAKVNYAKSKGLGGWIVWELSADYFPTQTPTQPLLDAIRIAMAGSGPVITTTALPNATQSTAYSTTMAASGGTPPYTWSISSGTLPGGLALASATGTISGTPSGTGTSSFTVKVTDATSVSATQALTITVSSSNITISPTSLPNATQNTAYSVTLTATGGAAPYTWSIASGSLPAGLTLGSSTTNSVAISGTPATTGTSSFTVQVAGGTATGTQAYSLTVSSSAIIMSPASLPDGFVDTAYSVTLTATGGTAPYSWSIISGSLPPGLILQSSTSNSAVISGTPTTSVTNSFTVQAADANSQTATRLYQIAISVSFTFTIIPSTLPDGTQNEPYSAQLMIGVLSGTGTPPYSWTIDSGSLPAGLSLTQSSGLISGTPTQIGTSNFTVRMTDAVQHTGARSYSITVNAPLPPLSITTTSLPNGAQSAPYTATLAATGGKAPYTWSIASGTLPAGLALTSTTGVISGTPTQTGTSSFTVQVTDGALHMATKGLSITVNAAPPPLSITTTSLPGGTQNSVYGATLAASGGTPPYTWSISSGALPSGLTLAASTGAISGTPTGAGTSSFTVKVTDSASATATQALSITVTPSTITISPTSLPNATQNTAYSVTLTAAGGAAPYTWSISSGSLPAGLALGSSTTNSVVISGTPTTAGTSNFAVQVAGGGATGTQALGITVNAAAPPLSISTTSLPGGVRNSPYSATLAATGGATPYTWSIASGSLPRGLTLASTTGVISGTPTSPGTSSFTVNVTDAKSLAATKAFRISVSPH